MRLLLVSVSVFSPLLVVETYKNRSSNTTTTTTTTTTTITTTTNNNNNQGLDSPIASRYQGQFPWEVKLGLGPL
jgi:hypothetical protein